MSTNDYIFPMSWDFSSRRSLSDLEWGSYSSYNLNQTRLLEAHQEFQVNPIHKS